MAFQDMYSELRGSVPKLPITFAPTLVNRAYREIREANLWSFNLYESAWITPPLVSLGTVSIAQGATTGTFDATAIAALNASVIANPYSPMTVRQLRPGNVAGIAGLYNLIQYDPVGGGFTLDRMYADPGGTGLAYNVLQAYYTAPYQDHLAWLSVRNMSMFLDLILVKTRSEIDVLDPQRSWYQFPTHVIPFQIDIRGQGTANASATLGYPMFELWGVPTQPFTYTCYGLRRGTPLVAPTDTVPIQIGEDLVLARARYYAYEWAEANKDQTPRAQGPDFRFLMSQAEEMYEKLLSKYRRQDKEFVNNYFSARNMGYVSQMFSYYNTLAGVAGPYSGI